MNSYFIQTTIILSVTFTDTVTGLPVDPTTVILQVADPYFIETNYDLADFTHPSTGLYQKTILPNSTGIWRYRWKGTGTVNASFEKLFEIRPSAFEPDSTAPIIQVNTILIAQLRQGLSVIDPSLLIAANIPSSPYDPINICWNGQYFRPNDALYNFIQDQFDYTNTEMISFYNTCSTYAISP